MDTLTYLLSRADELNVIHDYPAIWYTVNCAVLNVREGPGTSYKDIGNLHMDDKVVVRGFMGDWARISQDEWVHKDYLTRL